MDAIDAYNAQPQRARDACANAFDAIESAGKVVAEVPSGTFADVLKKFQASNVLARETIRML
jgi:predicted Fe-Mo cluster-binding NifX family protein